MLNMITHLFKAYVLCFYFKSKNNSVNTFTLARLSRMGFPNLNNWTGPFLFERLLGDIFHFFIKFY